MKHSTISNFWFSITIFEFGDWNLVMIIIIVVDQLLAPENLIADTDTIHLTRVYFNGNAFHSTEYLRFNLQCLLVSKAAEGRARDHPWYP